MWDFDIRSTVEYFLSASEHQGQQPDTHKQRQISTLVLSVDAETKNKNEAILTNLMNITNDHRPSVGGCKRMAGSIGRDACSSEFS